MWVCGLLQHLGKSEVTAFSKSVCALGAARSQLRDQAFVMEKGAGARAEKGNPSVVTFPSI